MFVALPSRHYLGPERSIAERVGRTFSVVAAVLATGLVIALVGIGSPLLTAAPVFAAPGDSHTAFPSTRLADIALGYVGQSGSNICRTAHLENNGQCKQVVNCLIVLAGGKSAADGSNDYAGSYLRVGGREVTEQTAQRGDIVQWGSGTTGAKHTAIVVSNLGNHKFDLVDSNWVGYEMVGHHKVKDVNMPDFDKPRFIRVGTDETTGSAPEPASAPPYAGLPVADDLRLFRADLSCQQRARLTSVLDPTAGNANDSGHAVVSAAFLAENQTDSCFLNDPSAELALPSAASQGA